MGVMRTRRRNRGGAQEDATFRLLVLFDSVAVDLPLAVAPSTFFFDAVVYFALGSGFEELVTLRFGEGAKVAPRCLVNLALA